MSMVLTLVVQEHEGQMSRPPPHFFYPLVGSFCELLRKSNSRSSSGSFFLFFFFNYFIVYTITVVPIFPPSPPSLFLFLKFPTKLG